MRLYLLAGAAMSEDVADLADRYDGATGLRENVEDRLAGRRRREILAVAGARETACGGADERARDDAADPVLVAERARDPAQIVKPLEPKSFLVGGDLQDAIDGGVDDRLSGPHMLGAEFVDDGGSGGVLVAEDPGKLRLSDQGLRQDGRKGWMGVREIAPVEGDRHARDLPMAGRRVLALRGLDAVAPGALQRTAGSKIRGHPPRRGFAGEPEAEGCEVGQVERPLPQARPVASALQRRPPRCDRSCRRPRRRRRPHPRRRRCRRNRGR